MFNQGNFPGKGQKAKTILIFMRKIFIYYETEIL